MRWKNVFAQTARQAKAAAVPGWRGMDFHTHLLPGVDDGMASFEDARAAIAGLAEVGFAGAVVTPHIYKDVFDNTAARLTEAFGRFCAALAAEGVGFRLHLAAEYFADEHFLGLIERDEVLALDVAGERWVLMEFSYMQETPYASACLSALRAGGYRPVIAHVERYRFVAQEPAVWFDRFARAEAVLQGDIGSLVGQFGEPVRKFAQILLDKGKIDIWGSDVHRPQQIGKYLVPGLARLKGSGTLNVQLNEIKMREAA